MAPDEGATIVPGGAGDDHTVGARGSGFGRSFSGSLSDRFEIVGPLGEGGIGVVYKARDLRLGREVALKRLKADSVESHGLIDRFEREARTVAGLEHPNIVRIYNVFDDADGLVIEMELLDGGSLQQRIDMEGALPVEDVARIGVHLCEALEAAHARRIVHRDIKPGNVLLTRGGTPKLADFGLAVERTKEGDGRQTVTGSLLGTPHYAAPEQLIDGKGVDARADLYSLGITLYAAATGLVPRVVKLDRIPESIRPVIEKCIEERPSDRYQSALELAEALRSIAWPKSPSQFPAELEYLVERALEDGVLTLKERAALMRRAEAMGLDGGEFGLLLDARSHAAGVRSEQVTQADMAGDSGGVRCRRCGTANERDAKFCLRCGASQFEQCLQCGRDNRSGARFCGGCGVDTSGANSKSRGVQPRLLEIDHGSTVAAPGFEAAPNLAAAPPQAPPRSQVQSLLPHRGTMILVLGILGLVGCHFLGIPAWIIGKRDLARIDAGLVDPSGRLRTRIGMILGICGTTVTAIFIVMSLIQSLL